MVQKVAPFTVKLLRKRWFPPFSTSLFQAFRSRGDSAKRCEEKKKTTTGGVPVFLLVFFSLFSFAPHSTIRTPGTSYFSTNSHRNACYTGCKKRKFWGTGNGYTCKMFHLKIGFHFTIVKIANLNLLYRKITITSTCHNCRYLKEINAFLIPCKTVYKTTRKKLKYISC